MHLLDTFKFNIVLATTLFPLLPSSALSSSVPINVPSCYMQNIDGAIVDLTYLCNKPLAASNDEILANSSINSIVPSSTLNTKNTTSKSGDLSTIPNTPTRASTVPDVTEHIPTAPYNNPVNAKRLPSVAGAQTPTGPYNVPVNASSSTETE